MSDAGWKLLGTTVMQERARRWPRRIDFARACGLGLRTIAALENGERTNFSPPVISAVESTLGWAAGSAKRVRESLDPVFAEGPEFTRLRDLWPRLSEDSRRMLVEVAERALEQ